MRVHNAATAIECCLLCAGAGLRQPMYAMLLLKLSAGCVVQVPVSDKLSDEVASQVCVSKLSPCKLNSCIVSCLPRISFSHILHMQTDSA